MNKLYFKNYFLLTILFILSLQGCTFTYYRLRNSKSIKSATIVAKKPCEFKYSIDIEYEPRLLHGQYPFWEDVPTKMVDRYIKVTQDAFNETACTAQLVTDNNQANLLISVLYRPFLSALPQEWLTGLSFGLVPSWGTRRGEFVLTFKNTISDREKKYYIDRPAFNHLIAFPFFWVPLNSKEIMLYKKALIDFVEIEKLNY
ncbi:MAG: hypothetical protein ACKVQC_07920 [Elusimicrobiota bacterium]